MKKKLTAIFLCAVVLCTFSFPAFASAADNGDAVIADDALAYVVSEVIGAFVGADGDAQVILKSSPNLAASLDSNSNGNVTASEVSGSLAKYMFVDYNTVDAISTEIAENSEYTVAVLDDGTQTVYVAVNLIEYPQLLNFSVFKEAVNKIVAKQSEYCTAYGMADAASKLMTYQHIAGELAMHTVVYAVTSGLGGSDASSPLNGYYNSAAIANLNEDEDRVPSGFIDLIGTFLMDVLFVSFYNIFRLFN